MTWANMNTVELGLAGDRLGDVSADEARHAEPAIRPRMRYLLLTISVSSLWRLLLVVGVGCR